MVFVVYIHHLTIAASILMCLLFTVLVKSEKSKSEKDMSNPRDKDSITIEMEKKQTKGMKTVNSASHWQSSWLSSYDYWNKGYKALIVCLHTAFLTTQF